ncbi:MAG: hypothetical protein HY525_16175 [Betaproteobacteria bacterium]|nr:hypothetical protein [Betaproteobacteria bacterium]
MLVECAHFSWYERVVPRAGGEHDYVVADAGIEPHAGKACAAVNKSEYDTRKDTYGQ